MLAVDTIPGFDGAPEPAVVWFGTRRVGVLAVTDRWFGPGIRWVRIAADDGQSYVLRFSEADATWALAALTRPDGDGDNAAPLPRSRLPPQ